MDSRAVICAGYEWLSAVARAGQPVVNGHVTTLAKLALNLAAPIIAEKKLERISAQQGSLLVEKVMRRLRKPEGGYLWTLPPSVQLAESVFKALSAIRRAGLGSEDLAAQCFEVADKGHELKQIADAYAKELRQRNWIDAAGALRLAIDRLKSDAAALPEAVLVLVPDDVDLTGLESQLLAAVPQDRLKRLRHRSTGNAAGGSRRNTL